MSRARTVCWDSDVLITILKGNDPDRTEDELLALREAVTAFDTGALVVVVPVTIYSEVISPIDHPELGPRFEAMLNRSNLFIQDLTKEISQISGAIRKELNEQGLKLKTPDSQFIATAIVHNCYSLQTFDERLLKLSGDDSVRGLRITKPFVEQAELGLE